MVRAGVVPRSPQGQRPHPDLPALAQLPLSLYKKVLLITHDAILPQLAQPTLMIDFLTRACDLGECGCLVHTTPQPPSVSAAASLTPVAAPPIPPTPQPLPRSTSSPALQPPPPTPCPACGLQLCVRGAVGGDSRGRATLHSVRSAWAGSGSGSEVTAALACLSVCRWGPQPLGLERAVHPDSQTQPVSVSRGAGLPRPPSPAYLSPSHPAPRGPRSSHRLWHRSPWPGGRGAE